MKKKILCLILALTLIFTTAAALAACGPVNDEHVLNVVCLKAGYGDEWIKKVAEKFEETHSGYKVNLTAIYEAGPLIAKNINSRNNIDDLYIGVGNSWKTYAAQGKFAELDDLTEEIVDGVKFKEKIADEYANSIYYPDAQGNVHVYRLPWIAATGGIFYNKKMFETQGWDTWLKTTYPDNITGVPETFTQLSALCEHINTERPRVENATKLTYVKPFVYTGKNEDYFDYAVYTWWAQLAGKENIESFLGYGSSANYSPSNPTYAKLKTAVAKWYELFGNDENYVKGSGSKDNHAAQQDFVNGYAAMMFDGDWMYNETNKYTSGNDNFQLAVMKTPLMDDAIYSDILYTIGEDQYIAVPKSSVKQELAKDFIKIIVSDWGCKNFLDEANGVLAYKGGLTSANTDDAFLKNLLDVRQSYQTKFTNFSSSLLYLADKIDIWGIASLRPYNALIGNTKNVDKAFEDIYTEVNRNWADWQKDVGIK